MAAPIKDAPDIQASEMAKRPLGSFVAAQTALIPVIADPIRRNDFLLFVFVMDRQ